MPRESQERNVNVSFRCSKEEAQAIFVAAHMKLMGKSEFLRDAALKAAKEAGVEVVDDKGEE